MNYTQPLSVLLLLLSLCATLSSPASTWPILSAESIAARAAERERRDDDAIQNFEQYSDRYADCVQCFDKDDLQLCHQIVLSCPLYSAYDASDEFHARYTELEHSESRLRSDFYCAGMFSLFVKERDGNCKVDIGASRDIVLAGLSYTLRRYVREVVDASSDIGCQGWVVADGTHIKSFGVLDVSGASNGEERSKEKGGQVATLVFHNLNRSAVNANNVRALLVKLMKGHAWDNYFSSDVNDVRVRQVSNDKIEVSVRLLVDEQAQPQS